MLFETLKSIKPLSKSSMDKAKDRLDRLAKPIGSLGELETLAIQLAGIQRTSSPTITSKRLIVMAGDHGIVEEGVASTTDEVTRIQAVNIANGVTGVGPLAKQANASIDVYNIGIRLPLDHPNVIDKNINKGTNNFTHLPAMTRQDCIKAIEVGIQAAKDAIKDGADAIAIGEMGIGNTTPSTALTSYYTKESPQSITWVGANLPMSKLGNKINVIERALALHAKSINDPIDAMASLGGYDLAGMTGVIIGASASNVPVVLDGYISTVSAIVAYELNPLCRDYMIASHASEEKGARHASEYLGISPYLHLKMRLGEGSGAVMMFNIIDGACRMLNEMITFDEAGFNPL